MVQQRTVLLLTATSYEYDLLRESLSLFPRSAPFKLKLRQCGVGKVSAAATTALETQSGIDLVISLGFASGSPVFNVGDIILPRVIQAGDVQIPVQLDSEVEMTMPYHTPSVPALDSGLLCPTLVSCDSVSPSLCDLYDSVSGELLFDMESHAIAQVSRSVGIPVFAIKCISYILSVSGVDVPSYLEARRCIPSFAPLVKALEDLVLSLDDSVFNT